MTRLTKAVTVISCMVVALLLVVGSCAWAGEITLAWDPNSEPDLAGYRIFCRQEGAAYDYNTPTWEGTATTCTFTEAVDGVAYYFVARAYDTSGNMSENSNEVNTEPPAAPCLLRIVR